MRRLIAKKGWTLAWCCFIVALVVGGLGADWRVVKMLRAANALFAAGFAFGAGKVFFATVRTDKKAGYIWTALLVLLGALFAYCVVDVGPTEILHDIMGELIMEIAEA